jgi:hypothetical protein
MTQSPNMHKQTTNQPPLIPKAALLLSLTLLDTTWRIFVPTIGGTVLGIALDDIFKTAPVMTIITIIVGLAVSVLLIIQQLQQVKGVK